MPKNISDQREERIGELITALSKKTNQFTSPPLIMIGGYALRAYLPLSRYSRDCDFAIPKGQSWILEQIPSWLSGMTTETKAVLQTHAYLRVIQFLEGRVKVALDFMEAEIHGRNGERIIIDNALLKNSTTATLQVGSHSITARVPSYEDFLILKIVSARPSDTRDIAALLWKNGLPNPEIIAQRATQIVVSPQQLNDKLQGIIDDIKDDRFLDSWRGTFITKTFTDKDKQHTLTALRQLQEACRKQGKH